MPGFLGGSSAGAGGAGGEITFPKEFVDPVTKLRISNPQNLIDTDFEYGLQPTKWETVELINNTPSFFSKSGDTTIPNIESITTNAGTREIIVSTALAHNLDIGIPINVQGTKSVTADGAYIINSIPNETTFTYLARDVQPETSSIEDLYSSIITGEFFQGSQLRLSESEGIVTDGESISELTVTTGSPHGFGVNTPFYFLNLNSTISQEFAAANTETKAFDASNSATAQTFDGSNTLSSINIDWTNSATVAGITSNVDGVSIPDDTITIAHGAENFTSLKVGDPLYYDVVASGGYFLANPRGVVFIGAGSVLGTSESVIQVTEVPNGSAIDITSNLSGTFTHANQARTFAGNNVNPDTEVILDVVYDDAKVFDGANENGDVVVNPQFDGTTEFTVSTQSGLADLNWPFNTMVRFDTDGVAPTGLVDGETYFINSAFNIGGTTDYRVRISEFPSTGVINIGTNGTGTMTFTEIGLSVTKDIVHIKNHGFSVLDQVKYEYPAGGRFNADQVRDFYYVQTVYDNNNFTLTHTLGEILPKLQSVPTQDFGTPIAPTDITIIGFEEPYTFIVLDPPSLPAGLSLNPSTGVVSGTPTEVYNDTVTIQITDANGAQDTMQISFEFTQPPERYSFTEATFTPGGNSGRTGPSVNQMRSGVGNPSWANDYLNVGERTGYMAWTVPATARYRFEVAGAGGGRHAYGSRRGGTFNPRGAILIGEIDLEQDEIIQLVVGQKGGETNRAYTNNSEGDQAGAGGGGASWVFRSVSDSQPLIVAGAGGGGSRRTYNQSNANPNGRDGFDAQGLSNTRGVNGNGGRRNAGGPSYWAGAGAGWFNDGTGGNQNSNYNFRGGGNGGDGGRNPDNGLLGGERQFDGTDSGGDGTFGGGGGGGSDNMGSGGGGGYSGGGGGRGSNDLGGGGGGSYFDSTVTEISRTLNTVSEDGYIKITKL